MPKGVVSQAEIDRQVQKSAYVQDAANAGTQRWVTMVVSRNPLDYRKWCEANGKSDRDPNYVMATVATARGLKDARLVVTPEGMWRPDIHQLMTALVPLLEAKARKQLETMGWGGEPPQAGAARSAPTQRSFDRL